MHVPSAQDGQFAVFSEPRALWRGGGFDLPGLGKVIEEIEDLLPGGIYDFQVPDLEDIEENIDELASNEAARCAQHPERCKSPADLHPVAGQLSETEGLAACARASRKMLRSRHRAAIAEYDRLCLASFVRRTNPDGAPLPDDERPVEFYRGGRNAHGAGILRSIGILETPRGPECGVLLRNDRTAITAHHCIIGRLGGQFASGQMHIRTLDRRGSSPWPVRPRYRTSGCKNCREQQEPRDDWVVLEISTDDPIGASETRLADLSGAAFVNVVGYSRTQSDARLDPADQDELWLADLRWQRKNFCLALDEFRGCLVTACHTQGGWSGSPIFGAAASDDDPIPVYGFVSVGEDNSKPTDCGQRVLDGTTFAASATNIRNRLNGGN